MNTYQITYEDDRGQPRTATVDALDAGLALAAVRARPNYRSRAAITAAWDIFGATLQGDDEESPGQPRPGNGPVTGVD